MLSTARTHEREKSWPTQRFVRQRAYTRNIGADAGDRTTHPQADAQPYANVLEDARMRPDDSRVHRCMGVHVPTRAHILQHTFALKPSTRKCLQTRKSHTCSRACMRRDAGVDYVYTLLTTEARAAAFSRPQADAGVESHPAGRSGLQSGTVHRFPRFPTS